MSAKRTLVDWGMVSVLLFGFSTGLSTNESSVLACLQQEAPKETSQDSGSQQKLPVKTVTLGDRSVRLYVNSEIVSDVTRINQSGGVVGTCEVTDESGFVTMTETFVQHGDDYYLLKPAKDYTSVSAEQIADDGTVVGFVSRAPTAAGRSLAASLWRSGTDIPILLPIPEGSSGSQAQDICSDGTRVTGYVSGSNPPHLRPCVWTWVNDQWTVEFLETLVLLNQYTMSSTVRISPDGKRIVACCTTRIIDGEVDSSLYAWEQDDAGRWKRRLISEDQIYIKDINNAGQMVGSILTGEYHMPVFVTEGGQIIRIPLLEGTVKGAAWGINESGMVVGINDEPEGPDGGPHAFQWNSRDGEHAVTEKVALGSSVYSTATSINDAGQIGGLADVILPSETPGQLPEERTLGYVTVVEARVESGVEKK